MKPNIFDIATKELNQDAFIAWLLQYADNEHQTTDSNLNECGKNFVTQLIKKQITNFDEQISKVKASRQRQNIDVWAEVNDKYLIIIEDKTFSSQHSNQLERYKETAKKWCYDNSYENPICIYLKTGNESQNSLNKIKQQDFSIYSRVDFIRLLEQFEDINNNIFTDFYERLVRMENSNKEFETKLINKWGGNDWQGFFQFLEKEVEIITWHYVNNANGGFWNAVLNWDYWNIYPAYIQLEQGKLCFKISTDPVEVKMPENITRKGIRDQLHNLILNQAKKNGYEHIRRPNKFGNGKYMTVAVVDKKNWLGHDNQTIDKQAILKTLTNYLKFLRKTISPKE